MVFTGWGSIEGMLRSGQSLTATPYQLAKGCREAHCGKCRILTWDPVRGAAALQALSIAVRDIEPWRIR